MYPTIFSLSIVSHSIMVQMLLRQFRLLDCWVVVWGHFLMMYLMMFVYSIAGEYSCLSVDLIFKRQFSYYLITIYVPGSMLVIVSWVSFWLDPHAVPARVALGVTTLLTMSTQTGSINSALPPVAYTKAIDVWQVSNNPWSLVWKIHTVFSYYWGFL